MRAALCHTLEKIELLDRPLPKIYGGELLLRVTHCGICGSDLKKLAEKKSPPLTLGHEVVGIVHQTAPEQKNFKVGERVVVAHHVPCFDCHYCRHGNFSMCREFKKSNLDPGGFAEFVRVPEPHTRFTTFRVPESVTDAEIVFTEPLACAVRCVRRLALQANDRVVIVGFGSIGLLLALLLRHKSMQVAIIERDPNRMAIAKKFKLEMYSPSEEGVDAVLFTAGNNEIFQKSLTWVRDGGTLCLFSDLAGELTLATEDLYKREITLLSSYSPGPDDLKEAFRLIVSREIDLRDIPQQFFQLEDLAQAFAACIDRTVFKAVVKI